MIDLTICFTYFKSLSLTNLEAALHSVRQQDFSRVKEIVVVDNDTEDLNESIQAVIDHQAFPVPTFLHSFKHNDASKTHSWSTNEALCRATTPWALFTRADYLLDFDLVRQFTAAADAYKGDCFVTSNFRHLHVDIGRCETVEWRQRGLAQLRRLPGRNEEYSKIDTGVWMMRRAAFDRVGGLDEQLTAWGHAQTEFQYRIYQSGTEFVRIPDVLFYHPQHAAPRDLGLANQQLAERGVDLKAMWARHDGEKVY